MIHMKNFKKAMALIGVIILVGLYLSTLVFAFIDTSTSFMYFKISVAATIFFPVILYVMTLFYKFKTPPEPKDQDDEL